MASCGARWRRLSPTRITTRWPLIMTLHCWSSASRWSSPTLSNPSAYPIPPTCSLQACPAGSQAGAQCEKEVSLFCRSLVIFLICLTVTEYFTIFECFSDGRATPLLFFFPFAHPALITIKTSRCSPIPFTISYSSPSFIFFPAASSLHLSHFILSASFPLMSVPFLYLSIVTYFSPAQPSLLFPLIFF